MKNFKAILLGSLMCSFFSVRAQEENTGVEKSIFNVQAGPIGVWASNESRLGNKFTLRTEVGLDMWFYDTFNDGSGAVLAPAISFEPRWYYNIEKRSRKGKHTANNSANFFTIAFEYTPDLFLIGSHPDYVAIPDQVTIIPKWGMRRAIARSNFNYELGGGVGYVGYLSESKMNMLSDVAIDLHIRIGYTF